MILHSKPLSEFVLIRANWWLIHSQWSEPPEPPIHPSLPRIHRSSVVHLTNVQLLCVLCDPCGLKPLLQNKANVKMGNINTSAARIKAYANKQRTMSNERYSKQSQFKPNSAAPLLRRERIQNLGAKRISRFYRASIKDRESSIENQESRIEYQKSSIIAQNKANVKIGKMNISTARIKAYANEQRTMSSERYPKQSQIKANFKRSKPISNAEPVYPACQTRDCRNKRLFVSVLNC